MALENIIGETAKRIGRAIEVPDTCTRAEVRESGDGLSVTAHTRDGFSTVTAFNLLGRERRMIEIVETDLARKMERLYRLGKDGSVRVLSRCFNPQSPFEDVTPPGTANLRQRIMERAGAAFAAIGRTAVARRQIN